MDKNRSFSDNINPTKTTKPIYKRPDLAGKYNEMLADSYVVTESEKSDGMDRGLMPKDKYPIGSVKATRWNQTRPMRRGKMVQQSHRRVNEDTLSCNDKGTMVDGGDCDA